MIMVGRRRILFLSALICGECIVRGTRAWSMGYRVEGEIVGVRGVYDLQYLYKFCIQEFRVIHYIAGMRIADE
jgi:hypothetical protein